MKTHDAYPRNIGQDDLVERGRFMARIANMVMYIYGRYNYALTAKILNAIRPDIGPFSADSVRKYMKNRQEPYPFKHS